MYNAKFINDNGTELLLSADNGIVFDITDMGGIAVNIGTAQALSQIGETILNQSVGGMPLLIKGVIFRNIVFLKNAIRKIFAPFNQGELHIGNYKIRVVIKTSPLFNPSVDNGSFTVQLYAPVPFWSKNEYSESSNYQFIKRFSFPTKYNTHKYGETILGNYLVVTNNGDISVPFSCEITATTEITDFSIIDILTLKKMSFVGTLDVDEKISVYRDKDGLLKVDKQDADGVVYDAISMLSDDSNLFELKVGETVLYFDENSAGKIIVRTMFTEMVGAMYEYI